MATLTGNFIISDQFVGKTGNATLKLTDTELGEILRVTWQGGRFEDSVIASKQIVALNIEGFAIRKGDKGEYAICTGVSAARPARGSS